MEDWQDYLRRMRSEVGGTGLTALSNARAMGASQSDINNFLRTSGWSVGSQAQAAGYGGGSTPSGTQSAPRNTSSSSASGSGRQEGWQDYLRRMRSEVGGTGLTALNNALAMGANQSDINNFLRTSGWSIGGKAQEAGFVPYAGGSSQSAAPPSGQLSDDLAALRQQANAYQAQAASYFSELQSYNAKFNALTSQYNSVLSREQSARRDAQLAKQQVKEFEQQRKDEREIEVAQQLTSLRGGYTASSSGSTGLGSLSSGVSRSISTGAKSGGVLDRAYKDIDPTDSVLDKNVATSSTSSLSSGGTSARVEARQRAMAAGTSAGDYYAKRFG